MNVSKRKSFFTKEFIIISCFYAASTSIFLSMLGLFNAAPYFVYILLVGALVAGSKSLNLNGVICFFSILCLLLFNCEGFWAASIGPCIGLIFSKNNKISINNNFGPFITGFYALITTVLTRFENLESDFIQTPKNYISVLVSYHIIFELIFNNNKKISIFYIAPILLCGLGIGNRSALFLLLAFLSYCSTLRKKAMLVIGVICLSLLQDKVLQYATEKEVILIRSYEETRTEYIKTFFENINKILSLKNQKYEIPEVSAGNAYDFHNSYLTLIWRDKLAGILKILIWCGSFSKITFFPQMAVSLRAGADTFLLGGVFDALTFFYISNRLFLKCKKIR